VRTLEPPLREAVLPRLPPGLPALREYGSRLTGLPICR
jgi:hypothetical protein